MNLSSSYPEKASWQANLLAGLVLLGLLVLGFGVDFKIFNARSHITGNEPGIRGYVIDRWGLETVQDRGAPLVFPTRDYTVAPLTLRERAARARYMSSALPPAAEGWALRQITLDDILLLRPDWAGCGLASNVVRIGYSRPAEEAHCPSGMTWHDTWVYVKGQSRIAIWLRYDRDRTMTPFYCMPQVSTTMLTSLNFLSSAPARGGAVLAELSGWTFRHLPMRERRLDGQVVPRPLRAVAEKRGDGLVQVYAMTNAAPAVLTGVLSALDFALLDAMLAPPA